jgi:hypothetical protein
MIYAMESMESDRISEILANPKFLQTAKWLMDLYNDNLLDRDLDLKCSLMDAVAELATTITNSSCSETLDSITDTLPRDIMTENIFRRMVELRDNDIDGIINDILDDQNMTDDDYGSVAADVTSAVADLIRKPGSKITYSTANLYKDQVKKHIEDSAHK